MLLNRHHQNNQQPVESTKTNQLNFNYHIKYWMFLGLCTSLLLHGLISFRHHNLLGCILGIQPVTASPTPTVNTIPSKYINNAPVPDWQSITFKSFVFSSPGSIELPNVEFPGYKSIRNWQAGQSLDEVMELGDFENVFNLENFSLQTIGQLSGISLANTKLSDFQTIKWQTVPELTKAIPSLVNEYVENVPPIRDLIKKILGVANINGQTIGGIINDFPQIKDIELGEIDLSDYNLTSIPGIEKTALKQFSNWQNTSISKIPGLNQVTFTNFPNAPVPQGSIIGKLDLPLKEVESNRQRSISGSDQVGFNVPCTNNCAHIELSGAGGITGSQWMSGKFQQVKGGFGILGNLNGGKEPTGRHPFGKGFKQAVWDINEGDGTASTAIFFRICRRGGWFDLGCSPYFIGPFPFFMYQEKSPIFLGTPLTIP